MKPGLYLLTQDVANPEADRRVKDDWRRRPQWDAGLYFRVKITKEKPIANGMDLEINCESVEVYRVAHRWTHHRLLVGRTWSGADAQEQGFRLSDDKSAQALVPHLEPVPLDNLEAGLVYYNENLCDSTMLLRILVGEGFVTETQALAVMRKLDHDDYEKYWPEE